MFCLSVCVHMHAWPKMAKEEAMDLWDWITDSCELPPGCWELKPHHLEDQAMLLNRYVKQSLLPWSCSISQAGLELTFSPGWLHNGNLFQGYRTSSPCPYPRISLWSCLFTRALLTYNSHCIQFTHLKYLTHWILVYTLQC